MTNAIVKLTDDPEYDKLVGAACILEHKTKGQMLLFYWELGRIVKAATGGATDGPRTVPQFLQHMQLAAPGRITLQEDSLYNALNINEHLTREDLQALQDAGAALRNALLLCNKNVTPEMRKDAIKRIAAAELKPIEVDEFIKQTRAQLGDGKDSGIPKGSGGNGGGSAGSGKAAPPAKGDTKRAATIQVTRLPDRVASLVEHIEGYTDSLDVLCSSATDEDEIDDIQRGFREGIKAMEDLFTTWEAVAKASRKVMDRTITTMSREERTGKPAAKKPEAKKAAKK